MKKLLVALALFSCAHPAFADKDDWTSKLSPRLKRAFQPMLAPEWSPRKEAELTAQERRALGAAAPQLTEVARQLVRSLQPRRTP